MTRSQTLRLILMFSASAFVVACVTPIAQTSVDRAAKAKSVPNAPYSKVMIVGIAVQGTRGREFEEQLVARSHLINCALVLCHAPQR